MELLNWIAQDRLHFFGTLLVIAFSVYHLCQIIKAVRGDSDAGGFF